MWGVFINSSAVELLAVLTAALAMDWTEESFLPNAVVVGFGVLGAIVTGVLAVLSALALGQAITPLGRAIRQAIQTFLGLPLAALLANHVFDLGQLGPLVVGTIVTVVLAFIYSLVRNLAPAAQVVPLATTQRTLAQDVLSSKAA